MLRGGRPAWNPGIVAGERRRPAASSGSSVLVDVGVRGRLVSLLGLARFAFGGVAALLIGLGGADDAVPLGIVTVVSMTLAVATYAGLMRGRDHGRQAPSLRRPMTLECATEAL